MKIFRLYFLIALFAFWGNVYSQTAPTYAEKLGYPKGSKLLILHVDDAGMSAESNAGAIMAIEKGISNSCSIMMPCPWVPGFIHYLKNHPSLDAGIHLTITSEWKEYRWGPLMGKTAVPGLVDGEGNLWADVSDVQKHATAEEVGKEINAQLERCIAFGWKPTHLDTHMGAMFASPAFIQQYVKLGIDNKIPVMLPAGHSTLIKKYMYLADAQIQMMHSLGEQLWNAGLPVLDDLHNESYDWQIPAEAGNDSTELSNFKTQKYIQAFQSLKPGITMMIMHCTLSGDHFDSISNTGALRKADLLAMINPALKEELTKDNIVLVTWRELMERRSKIK